MSAPRSLDVTRLRAALDERWGRVVVVDETPSTNADLIADAAAPDRSVLVAELQTAGRGRLDRSWLSPRGRGLTFSVLLRPEVPLVSWGWLPLLAGVALAEAVRSAAGVDAVLKWPNDLLEPVGERKLAGILAQTGADAVVIGIGLNVSTTADELALPSAASLAMCSATEPDRDALLVEILRRLDARYAQWSDCGGDAEACGLAAAYDQLCVTLGREVQVSNRASQLRGRASAIDAAGRLVVESAGQSHAFSAGDVEHVRSG